MPTFCPKLQNSAICFFEIIKIFMFPSQTSHAVGNGLRSSQTLGGFGWMTIGVLGNLKQDQNYAGHLRS